MHTNIEIYSAIATEAFEEMRKLDSKAIKPKESGSGFIITYDREHKSFKNAMIVIVFTGMWLGALLHQEIVKKHGQAEFKKVDKKFNYEQKLKKLGFSDESLLSNVMLFRETRKELVHEKAFLESGNIKKAQEEANLANEIMRDIAQQLHQLND